MRAEQKLRKKGPDAEEQIEQNRIQSAHRAARCPWSRPANRRTWQAGR